MTAGRPRDFDEEVVLDKAMELFWKQGYEATSLEQLLTAMGMERAACTITSETSVQYLNLL